MQKGKKAKRQKGKKAKMFAVYLCPTRNTLFLTTVKGLWITYHQVCAVCEAMCTYDVDGQAQTLLLTRVANPLHLPTRSTLASLGSVCSTPVSQIVSRISSSVSFSFEFVIFVAQHELMRMSQLDNCTVL